ncbi:MAG: site-2 protease family protein [bacterium]|nr:site-2 protease family protein [bacterium]
MDFEPKPASDKTAANGAFPPPVERPEENERPTGQRRIVLPIFLFIATCISTFFVGAMGWMPSYYGSRVVQDGDWMAARQAVIEHWDDGLIYMGCLLLILFAHEMGHFVATLIHRIPASFPFFIPMPINPFGTMGAVIAMQGMKADRKQMFDIGIAGPLAGLVFAIPIMIYGIYGLDLSSAGVGPVAFDSPLAVRWTLDFISPPGYTSGKLVYLNQMNPYYMAGWVGLLITGLNMLPVGQLDGGHVTYALAGRWAHWFARGFLVVALIFIIVTRNEIWGLMLFLVILMGPDHPPTRDDEAELGPVRIGLGIASLLIPILCFAPSGLQLV